MADPFSLRQVFVTCFPTGQDGKRSRPRFVEGEDEADLAAGRSCGRPANARNNPPELLTNMARQDELSRKGSDRSAFAEFCRPPREKSDSIDRAWFSDQSRREAPGCGARDPCHKAQGELSSRDAPEQDVVRKALEVPPLKLDEHLSPSERKDFMIFKMQIKESLRAQRELNESRNRERAELQETVPSNPEAVHPPSGAVTSGDRERLCEPAADSSEMACEPEEERSRQHTALDDSAPERVVGPGVAEATAASKATPTSPRIDAESAAPPQAVPASATAKGAAASDTPKADLRPESPRSAASMPSMPVPGVPEAARRRASDAGIVMVDNSMKPRLPFGEIVREQKEIVREQKAPIPGRADTRSQDPPGGIATRRNDPRNDEGERATTPRFVVMGMATLKSDPKFATTPWGNLSSDIKQEGRPNSDRTSLPNWKEIEAMPPASNFPRGSVMASGEVRMYIEVAVRRMFNSLDNRKLATVTDIFREWKLPPDAVIVKQASPIFSGPGLCVLLSGIVDVLRCERGMDSGEKVCTYDRRGQCFGELQHLYDMPTPRGSCAARNHHWATVASRTTVTLWTADRATLRNLLLNA